MPRRAGRRFSWINWDVGREVPVSDGYSDTRDLESAPQFGRSLLWNVHPATDAPGGGQTVGTAGVAGVDDPIADSFLRDFEDGTITRILGATLFSPSTSGVGVFVTMGIIMLPAGVYDAAGDIPINSRPNPAAYDQADWLWVGHALPIRNADGTQAPFHTMIDNRSQRIIDGKMLPALIVHFESTNPGTAVPVLFAAHGRMLVRRA